MKKIGFYFLFVVYVFVNSLYAQIVSVNIGINGLTCSACSYGTERSIRKLDFVKDLQMDLNSKTAQIQLVPDVVVDFHALAQKVVDAGFSVRHVKAKINFNEGKFIDDFIYNSNNLTILFVDVSKDKLSGEREIVFLDKDFTSAKEYKKWKVKVTELRNKGKALENIYIATF
ncbi:MAG: heavy-metal-associated domain-containing protein [Bacteroidetes bacterium]|nr:heavy-metal-associated domain-containing protein [Bacteroidota bacterium]